MKDFCPHRQAREIPFSALSTAINFVDLAKPSSEVFCSAEQITCSYPEHHVKRQNLAKVATSSLGLKEKGALTLLNSTSCLFTIGEVADLLNVSQRTIFYLKAKIKLQ